MFGPFWDGADDERNERFAALLEYLGASEVPTSALKCRRKVAGLSQHDLARASGVSQPAISRIEAGATPLRGQTAERLDRALGTDARAGELPLEQLEILAALKRRAIAGEVSPERMERAALLMASNEPSDERMRPAIDAAVGAMLDVAETAAKIWRPAKSRNGFGIRKDKPLTWGGA